MALNSSYSDVLTTKYSNTVFELAAQEMSKLRGAVEVVPLAAEDMLFPRIGSQEVQQLQQRSPLIIPSDIQWDNRRLASGRVGVPFFLDEYDAERMLADPKSILAMRSGQALERNLDRVIIGSFMANAYTGRNGTVPVSAAVDGVVTLDATNGFTYDTLLQIQEQLESVELGTRGGTDEGMHMYLITTEQEKAKLMREGTLISSDFTGQRPVDTGKMTQALGFTIITYGSATAFPMLTVNGTTRDCFAICSGAVKLGITQNWKTKIEPVNNRWDTIQVLASGAVGATRMEGPRIIRVQTTIGQ